MPRKNQSYHRYNKAKPKIGTKISKDMENSTIVEMFKTIAEELDAKHDKYERILKYGRDITIESKRIIFQLHTIDKESKRDAVLKDACERLNKLTEVLFKLIAFELENEDPYQYYRAYNYGLQEFIEAVTLYQYLSTDKIDGWQDIEQKLRYTVYDDPVINAIDKKPINGEDGDKSSSPDASVVAATTTNQVFPQFGATNQLRLATSREIKTLLPPHEFILALGDLSGELMRKCINNIAIGEMDSCFAICKFVRKLYACFLTLHNLNGKEITRKLYSVKQNVNKIENVCFTIAIRGHETPKHMLLSNNALSNSDTSLDNGNDAIADSMF